LTRTRSIVLVLLGSLLAALAAVAVRVRPRGTLVARIVDTPSDDTGSDADGAVHSIQAADLVLPAEELDSIWDPGHLERLARTYWLFLSRVTLGLVHVTYTETSRAVVLVFPFLKLLWFHAPEYEMDEHRGIVRWRIAGGVLVARKDEGYLEIDIERCAMVPGDDGSERLHVEVAVKNFYPSISSRLGRWIYENTQSRIHVFVTYGFLRSLQRLDLADSHVGRFAGVDDVPDPTRASPRERAAA
jgi:hypothetical protein